MIISQYIADCITHRMNQLGINRLQLAQMLDCSPSSVTKYLSGTHNFTIETLQKIQDVLYINFFHYTEQQAQCFPCEVKPIMKQKLNNTNT
jgi:transcriptional regulator with XRE-family HTH domain